MVSEGDMFSAAEVCPEGDQRYVPPGVLTEELITVLLPAQIVALGTVIVGIGLTIIADVAVEEGQPGAETVTVIDVDEFGLREILEVVAPFDHKYVALFGKAVRTAVEPLQIVALLTEAVIP